MEHKNEKAVIEAILFTMGEAVEISKLSEVLELDLRKTKKILQEMEEEYERFNQKNSLISYQLGFHAEYTCSHELLMQVAALAHKYKAPIYAHLAETEKEVEECKDRYSATPAEFLDSLGMFDYGGGGYHCVYMTEKEPIVNEEIVEEAVQAQESVKAEQAPEAVKKEKTAEELALEQGYYACCFRSH